MSRKIWMRGSVLVIQTAIFPYYLLFLKNVGETYSTFSFLYAIFTITSAASFFALSFLNKKPDNILLYRIAFFGLSLCMFFVPLASNLMHVCLLQGFMGLFQAFYKIAEKQDEKEEKETWKKTNLQQFILHLIVLLTILGAGWIMDWLSIHMLFWFASAWYFSNIFIKNK